MEFTRVKISTIVPIAHADSVRQALGEAGAGEIGEYTFCSYTVIGTGRFMPSVNANPSIGEAGRLEIVTEEQIEVVCDRSKAKHVIAALKRAHPYEEVPLNIVPLIDEAQL